MRLIIEIPDECAADAARLSEWLEKGRIQSDGEVMAVMTGNDASDALVNGHRFEFAARILGMELDPPRD